MQNVGVKKVVTLRVLLPLRKCKIFNEREIFLISFIISEKINKHGHCICAFVWKREKFIVHIFCDLITHKCLLTQIWFNLQADATNDIVVN